MQGEEVGSIIWTQNGEVIAEVELVSTQTVAAPDFWEGIVIWWQRFIGGFFGDEPHATSKTTLPQSFDLKINYLSVTDLAEAA